MNKDYALEVIFIGERESLFVFLGDGTNWYVNFDKGF